MSEREAPLQARRLHVRVVEFVGDQEFTQGRGMTWDSCVIELADGEEIVNADATCQSGQGFSALVPVMRLWIATATEEALTPTEEDKKALEPPTPVKPPMHYAIRVDGRSRWEKIRDAFSHRHHVVFTQWTQDDSSWADDPAALDICSCGFTKRMWGPSDWTPPRSVNV